MRCFHSSASRLAAAIAPRGSRSPLGFAGSLRICSVLISLFELLDYPSRPATATATTDLGSELEAKHQGVSRPAGVAAPASRKSVGATVVERGPSERYFRELTRSHPL